MSLQQHVAVLAQSGALHGEGGGGTRLTSLEVKFRICHGALSQGHCGGEDTAQAPGEGTGPLPLPLARKRPQDEQGNLKNGGDSDK